jgi:hypothetical protein
MRPVHQLQTIFGDSFVQEEHRDNAHDNLPLEESRAIGIAGVWLVFFAVIVVSVALTTFGKAVDVVMSSVWSH